MNHVKLERRGITRLLQPDPHLCLRKPILLTQHTQYVTKLCAISSVLLYSQMITHCCKVGWITLLLFCYSVIIIKSATLCHFYIKCEMAWESLKSLSGLFPPAVLSPWKQEEGSHYYITLTMLFGVCTAVIFHSGRQTVTIGRWSHLPLSCWM